MSRSALRPSMPFPIPSCDESEVASIHSITDQLLVTALPARKFVSKPEATASGPSSTSANPLPPKVPTSSSTNPPLSHPPPSANPPCDDTTDDDARVEDELLFRQHLAYLRSFLEERWVQKNRDYLLVSLAAQPPDPELVEQLRGQVVHVPWEAAGAPASELPTTGCLLRVVYAVTAALEWKGSGSNTRSRGVILACENGLLRTGVAVAAYLRYAHAVPCARDGFLHFLECTVLRNHPTGSSSSLAIYQGLPPSVQTLLQNWDTLIEWQTYVNEQPLWLRAITLQGIPVEDQPCLDLYDSTGRHVYSSHAWLHDMDDEDDDDGEASEDFDGTATLAQSQSNVSALTGVGSLAQQMIATTSAGVAAAQASRQHSPWSDDEGFYNVNRFVLGDFCLLCRFGGPHALVKPNEDTTKLLFRYAHSTTVLPAGLLECPASHCDIQPRYQPFLDLQDFLVTFVWEASWEGAATEWPTDWSLPPLVFGEEAVAEGCRLLREYYVRQPTANDLSVLRHEEVALADCPSHVLGLLWQMSAGQACVARNHWLGLVTRYQERQSLASPRTHSRKHLSPTDASVDGRQAQKILEILNGVDDEMDGGVREDEGEPVGMDDGDTEKLSVELSSKTVDTVPPGTLQWASTIGQPHVGDIPVMLGLRGHAYDWAHTIQQSDTLPSPTASPRLPVLSTVDHLANLADLDDPIKAEAVELFLQLQHAGVSLDDLVRLGRLGPEAIESLLVVASETQSTESNPNEAKHHEEETKAEQDAVGVIANSKEPSVGEEMGVPLTSSAAVSTESLAGNNTQEKVASVETREGSIDSDAPAEKSVMKKDPRFEKYWKMKSVGLPPGAIMNAMRRDDVDVSILELDWDKNYEEQIVVEEEERPSTDGPDKKVAMKNDSRFEKYWKMKSVGLPQGAIMNAMRRDDVDISILELDWDKNYDEQKTSQAESVSGSDGPPMKEDPRFVKYFKMKGIGLPEGAIRNAMGRDDVDGTILDLDWDMNYEAQTAPPPASTAVSGPPMKEDARFEKYWKMKCVGLPNGAIENAMARDGVDAAALSLDWEANYEAQTQPPSSVAVDGPPMKEDPRFQKFWKMKSVGLPDGAIRNALTKDGLDSSLLDLDWGNNYEVQRIPPSHGGVAATPPMKEDPTFLKFWKMKTVGLPDGAIRNAMAKDGLDPSLLDLDWNKSLASHQQAKNSGPPVKDDPEFTKYFRMLTMGLPPGAVKNAMSRDGKDPSVLDFNPDRSLSSQTETPVAKRSIVPKKKVRRKKIFWKPIEPEQIKEDSLWSLVKGKVSMSHLNYDLKEFEDLFTESADPADKKKKKKPKATASNAKKKAVRVIDGKRSMNGGIILLRLKMDYGKIADMLDRMEQGKLDSTQLMALKEYLPTSEERTRLSTYMENLTSEDEISRGYHDLSECEKYMWTVRLVDDAESKFDCMLFKAQFRTRVDELADSTKIIEQACDEVKTSERLRKVFAMILTLVNTINTGGESHGVAHGFSLDALLKLNEAKAFDKKTSVLQYLVKLVRQNDENLLDFHKELKHIKQAENLLMDSITNDMKNLSDDLEGIREIVEKAAEAAEANGERTLSLEDLKEQRTTIRVNGAVAQFNQVDHITGRTPMERFMRKASNEVSDLVDLSGEVKSKYQDLLAFFGEDSQMPSNHFFGTMNRFTKEFIVSEQHVEKEEKAKEKERRRNEKKAKATPSTQSPRNAKARGFGGRGKRGEETEEETDIASAHPLASLLTLRSTTDKKSVSEEAPTEAPSTSAHPLAAMFAARGQDSVTAKSSPALAAAKRINVTKDSIPTGDKATKEAPSLNPHPLAAMLGARQKGSGAANASEAKPKAPSSSAHPLAAMLAARQQDPTGKKPEATTGTNENGTSNTHPLAAMLISRQGLPIGEDGVGEPFVSENETSTPSVHPLAAMLATRQQEGHPEKAEFLKSIQGSHPLLAGGIDSVRADDYTEETGGSITVATQQTDDKTDTPASCKLESSSSQPPSTTDAAKDRATTWLNAVKEVTGSDQVRPIQRQSSDDEDSTDVAHLFLRTGSMRSEKSNVEEPNSAEGTTVASSAQSLLAGGLNEEHTGRKEAKTD